MRCLRIRLLGDFRMTLDGNRLPSFPTREAHLLFAFLVLNRERLFRRRTLADRFFSDQPTDTARKRLRTAIWRVRSTVEPEGVKPGRFLTVTNREVGFNSSCDYWLDIEEFEKQIADVSGATGTPLVKEDGKSLERTLSLYRGDLLEGIYEDWCLWEQERLKMLRLRGLEILMDFYAANSDWHEAIVRGQQLLSHDPLREHIHRSLMRFYYLVGDRPAALLQYDGCARLLAEELEIEPMRETTDLYLGIKSECSVNDLAEEQIETREQAVADVDQSKKDGVAILNESAAQIDEARVKLRYGIDLVEKLIEKRY